MNAPQRKTPTRVSLVELDSVELAVPQTNLHTVESVLDIRPARDARSTGYIELHGEKWPVYCPTDNLDAILEIKAERRICAILIAGDGLFGLVCRKVTNVDSGALRAFELPICMRSPDTPLRGLGLMGTRVVCLTTAPLLYAMFTAQHASDEAGVISARQPSLGDPLRHTAGAPT